MTDLVDLDELNKSLEGLVLNIVEGGKIHGIIKEKYPMLHEAVEAYREEMVRITSRVPKYVWQGIKKDRGLMGELTQIEQLLAGQKITVSIGDKSYDVVLEASFTEPVEASVEKKCCHEVPTDPLVKQEHTSRLNKNDALYQYYTRLRKYHPENLILICTGTFYEALFKDALMLQERYNTLVLHHSFSDGEPFPYASVHSDKLHVFLKENLKDLGTVLVAEYQQGDEEVVQIYSLAGDKLNAEIINLPPLEPIEVVKNNRLDTNPLDNNNFDA